MSYTPSEKATSLIKSTKRKMRSYKKERVERAKPELFAERVTQDVQDSLRSQYLNIVGGLRFESGRTEFYEEVEKSEFLKLPLYKGVDKAIKSDPTLDFAVAASCILLVQSPEISAESDQAQREIDEFLMMMESRKNPFNYFVDLCASSLITRGNLCAEVVFDEMMMPMDLLSVDTAEFEWRLQEVAGFGQMWRLGQYQGPPAWNPEGTPSEDQGWIAIESPNVYWDSVNPLAGERAGRNPLATAVPAALDTTQMLTSLIAILNRHGFPQRQFIIQYLESLKLGKDVISVDDANSMQQAAKEQALKLRNMEAKDVPVYSDNIKYETDDPGDGAVSADTAERTLQRQAFRGSRVPPTIMGSNEFTAESSAKSQNLFFSTYLTTLQQKIKMTCEWAFRRVLRSRGIAEDPVFSVKSVDTVARVEEARAFNEIMKGIKMATGSGIPVDVAVQMYEEESGNTFSAEIKQALEEVVAEQAEMKAQMMEGSMQNDPESTNDTTDTV